MCLAPEDEASLTPDERIHEIAAILAEGVRRARHGATSPPEIDAHLPESDASGLEVCSPSGPDGSRRQPERTQEV